MDEDMKELVELLNQAKDVIKQLKQAKAKEIDNDDEEYESKEEIPDVSFMETLAGIMTCSDEELKIIKALIINLEAIRKVPVNIETLNSILTRNDLPPYKPSIKGAIIIKKKVSDSDSIFD